MKAEITNQKTIKQKQEAMNTGFRKDSQYSQSSCMAYREKIKWGNRQNSQ